MAIHVCFSFIPMNFRVFTQKMEGHKIKPRVLKRVSCLSMTQLISLLNPNTMLT